MMVASSRLDTELVRRGLARSRRRAAELVDEGRVTVDGAVARKPSQPVREDEGVEVAPGEAPEYVSRAGYKLAGALDALARLTSDAPVVDGASCLDAGASTGGFTQVLLERGAVHVTAVDVGHGQMSGTVAADPRVRVVEGTDVRQLTATEVQPPPGLITADLSFISLTKVVPVLMELVAPGGHLLLMVKPQFEVGRERLGSGGVVTSDALREDAVVSVAEATARVGGDVRAVVPSSLPGPAGNREYFLWAVAPAEAGAADTMPMSGHGLALRVAVHSAVVDDRPVLVDTAPTSTPRRPT